MDDFYSENNAQNYLQHHGIKGQRWGKQNGPPYPLSDKLHNFVVKKQAKMKEDKANRDEKRRVKKRQKILHDPEKLYKHAMEFSKEELDEAIAKIDSMNRVKDRIPGNKEKELDKKIKKLAPSAQELEKNEDKFTTEELREAANRIGIKHDIYNKKMSELDRPRKFLQVGSDLLGTIAAGLSNAKRIGEMLEPKYNPETGLTKLEERNLKLYEKYKDNPEMKKALSVAVKEFGDGINRANGKSSEYEDVLKTVFESGSINPDDLPDDIIEILKNKKGFKQYFN